MEHLKPGLAVSTRDQHLHIWSYKSASERDLDADRIAQMDYAASVDLCDVRSHQWATPNKIAIETGCKPFDQKCSSLITGNVIANTQLSFYIRPRNEQECNGKTFSHGVLQARDLDQFRHEDLHAGAALEYIQKLPLADVNHLLLNVVFHWVARHGLKARVVHGAVLTDASLKLIRRFDRAELGQTNRRMSQLVMDSVEPFLTDAKAINRRPMKCH